MQITKHFSIDEFIVSSTAIKNHIDNAPTADIIDNIYYVAYMLELIRKYYTLPIHITSGYRCRELNQLVGGSPSSAHIQGLAVDIDNGKEENLRLYYLLLAFKSLGFPIKTVINENDFSWIHITFNKL